MNYPKLSVIIPVLNQDYCLEDAIKSTINQDFKDYELIVIDGKSQDNTLKIIKKYDKNISYWESSKDKNLYDAMNKGIDKASGEWIYFLGADDKIDKNIFQKIFSKKYENIYLIYGNIKYDNNEMFIGKFSKRLFIRNNIHHQGAIYHRRCFYNNYFDIKYSILADYDFNLTLFQNKIKTEYFDSIFAICGSNGISKKITWKLYKQEFNIKKNRLNAVQFLVYGSITIMKFFLKKLSIS